MYCSTSGDAVKQFVEKVKWQEKVIVLRDTRQGSHQECGCLICQVNLKTDTNIF